MQEEPKSKQLIILQLSMIKTFLKFCTYTNIFGKLLTRYMQILGEHWDWYCLLRAIDFLDKTSLVKWNIFFISWKDGFSRQNISDVM